MSHREQMRPNTAQCHLLAAVCPMRLCRERLEFSTNTATEEERELSEPRVFKRW